MDPTNLTRPETENDDGIDKGGHDEYEVVVRDMARLQPQHDETGQGIEEDQKGGGGVEQHAGQITELLNDGELRFPELHIREQRGGTGAPAHLGPVRDMKTGEEKHVPAARNKLSQCPGKFRMQAQEGYT
jgi:hypothetical protein